MAKKKHFHSLSGKRKLTQIYAFHHRANAWARELEKSVERRTKKEPPSADSAGQLPENGQNR